MSTETLLMVFTGVLALAVVIQTFLFFGIYRGIRQLKIDLDGVGNDLRRNAEIVSTRVDEGLTAVKSVTDGLKPVVDKLADATEIVRNRVAELDVFLAETTITARQEIQKVQDTIQSASQKAEQTLDQLRKSLLGPVTEINAFSRGIKVAIDVLFRRRRSPSGSAQDEEMFI